MNKSLQDLALLDIHIFLEAYQIKTERGEILDFKDHPYLWDIYQDESKFIAIRKAAQIGFTTAAIIKSIWLAKARKMDIIYTMPTSGDAENLVKTKVNRIIEQNPVLQEWVSGSTLDKKQVGNSVIYYPGTWTPRAALSVSSDLNIHDEVDRSNLPVIEQFSSRLQHSKYGFQWLFSNPSTPDVGVDKLWNRSDQKHYFYTCSKCNKKQYLTMKNIYEGKDFDPIQKTGYYFGCVKCKVPLERYKGEWIARWEDKNEVSGYWISLLMNPKITADYIKLQERTKPADFFDNFILGIPHTGSGNIVTKDVFLRNLTDRINRQEGRIVIGVDPGVVMRYVIGNQEGLFYYGECTGYKELELLLKRWPKAIMVIDQGGDIVGSRDLRERYKNRVFLAFYGSPKKDGELFDWNDDANTVTIDRNNGIQLLIDEFTDKRIPIYGTETDWYDYWVHWSHIHRTVEEDRMGRPVYKWVRTDRDDFVHATLYWRCGIDRFMNGPGAIIDIQSTLGEIGYTASPDGKFMITRRQSY